MKKVFMTFLLAAITIFSACGKQEQIIMDEAETGDITITLQPYYFLDYNTNSIIQKYETAHTNVHFEILPDIEWTQMDSAMARTYSDIANGGGPDIIMMTNTELLDFAKNGCLRDLSSVLSADTKSALINNVLEYGKFEDKIYLLPQNMNLTSLTINKKYSDNSFLTIENTINIIEKREAEGKPFEYLFVSSGGLETPFDIFMRCIDESNFIDRENGTASFDSELFIKLLNICKRYDNAVGRNLDPYKLLKEDSVLGFYTPVCSVFSYSTQRAILGDDYVEIGVPSDAGNGKLMTFATGISVNKNTTHFKAISDFLNFLYSSEARIDIASDELRTDIYVGRVHKDKYTQQYGIKNNLGDFTVLDTKEDGSTYIDEYFDMLNSFTLSNPYGDQDTIVNIIYDEAEPFFVSDKSAEEVAKSIQSRITLYLMEKE